MAQNFGLFFYFFKQSICNLLRCSPVCERTPSSMGKIHLWVAKPFDLTLIICQQMELWGNTTEVGQLSRATVVV